MPGRVRRSRGSSGIVGISVEGYKSLRKRQNIEIRPLTIIAGVNSSGKSSIIQPLLLLKQTIDAGYDPGPLQLDGPNVSVTAIEQILSKGRSRNSQVRSFSISVIIDGKEWTLKFGKSPSGDLRVLETWGWYGEDQKGPVKLREGMGHEEIQEVFPDGPLKIYRELSDRFKDRSVTLSIARDRFFLNPVLKIGDVPGNAVPLPGFLTTGSSQNLENEISRIIHLPALRGNPRRTYRTAAVEDRFPGTFDTYTAGIISAWQNNKRLEKLALLKSDLEELGLTWKVEAKQLDDTQVELLVGRLPHARQSGARDLVNIADVGFGVSQTLPVVVALIAAQRDQVVYLEQPEIHLHPRAQAAFGGLVKKALDRGVKVIIETHSALFIRSIQTQVAQSLIKTDEVVLHWFTRDSESGNTEISTASLDEYGAFGDWPEDFDDVYLDSESRYLDAATRRSTWTPRRSAST
jgi:hypothetical protein